MTQNFDDHQPICNLRMGDPQQQLTDISRALARFKALNSQSDRTTCDPVGLAGDHDIFNQQAYKNNGPARPAAVLIPLIVRDEDMRVILTKRQDTLSVHAGQVAFAGGRVEEEDQDATSTALREAQEEIGLDPERASAIGVLRPYLSGTNFLITPVVAHIDSKADFRADPSEVAEIFEVPLNIVLDKCLYAKKKLYYQEAERYFYELNYQGYRIWGVTAGILMSFILTLDVMLSRDDQ